MAEHVCEQCGASNAPTAQFCHSCDAYLGWDKGATTIGGQPVTGTVPRTVGEVATEVSLAPPTSGDGLSTAAPAGTDGQAPGSHGEASSTHGEAPHRVVAEPRVHLDTREVTLLPHTPVTLALRVHNASSVVDGFVVHPDGAPRWLDLSAAPLRLLPDQEGVLETTLRMNEQVLVFAQRLTVRLVVSSEADPGRTRAVDLALTVPPLGPAASLEVQPQLLRLTDASRARFVVRIDNRSANFPRTFDLSGSDFEGVVRFGFLPTMVQVPPGQQVEVRGHFVAPGPPPGQEAQRQLTVSASNDEGQLSTPLTVVQQTSPEKPDVPVAVRLAPSELRATNAAAADFEVHVDNRGGHRQVALTLVGRDPAHLLTFSLVPQRVVAEPGQVAVAHGRVQTEPVARGQTVTRPFSIVASDGVRDTESSGTLVVTTTPAPLTTAELRVVPRNLTRTDDRRGSFAVEVDNTRGREEFPVWLSGADSHGMARLIFDPPALGVPAGGIARSRLTVDSPRPPRGQSVARELEITAGDGEGRLVAAATFTQVSSDRRPLLRTLLVLVGAGLVLLGLVLPFALVAGNSEVVVGPVRIRGIDLDAVRVPYLALASVARVLLAVLAAAMAFGLTGESGSLTRKSAVLIVLVAVGYVVAADAVFDKFFDVDVGAVAVAIGAVLGYIGGVLARQRG